ncbi:MAG: quinol:cytochrome C oxidoreductase [Planctomycetaceae bacterium]|nr:quinol:cytochrome C oxidoreductase [Planctomycetaceae bacterium]
MSHHGQIIPVEDPGTIEQTSGSLKTVALVAGLGGLVLSGLLATSSQNTDRLQYSYLLNFCFVLSICLGALFFVLIQHITRAGWSAVVRRLAEIMTTGFLPLALLFIPIVLLVINGSSVLFEWNNHEVAQNDPLLKHKMIFLNEWWFSLRAIVYFAFWIVCGKFYLSSSTRQDQSGDPRLTQSMGSWSAICLILFALSISFAAIDWIMSLDPRWFSTIIGVYYFANANVAFYATLAITVYLLNSSGLLVNTISVEHRHDIGKLLFGFNCFWAYIAFSQYLLYWYANIPEETMWFMRRQENGWEVVSMILICGHFVIPFLGLMSRTVKRNPSKLLFWAVFLLTMCWIDLYWLIIPEVSPENPALSLLDLTSLVGIAGITLAGILKLSDQVSLLARKDPRIQESLSFHNI